MQQEPFDAAVAATAVLHLTERVTRVETLVEVKFEQVADALKRMEAKIDLATQCHNRNQLTQMGFAGTVGGTVMGSILAVGRLMGWW